MLCSYAAIKSWSIIGIIKNKDAVHKKEDTLAELRCKKIKTIEEQKLFLSTKYPKKKFNWKDFFVSLCIIMIMFFVFSQLINLIEFVFNVTIRLNIWVTLLSLMICDVIIGLILRKLKLGSNQLLDVL